MRVYLPPGCLGHLMATGSAIAFLRASVAQSGGRRRVWPDLTKERPFVLIKRMDKGQQTRSRIVERAMSIASVEGLSGLSIGSLASNLGMSKSGLFGHFGSKEQLQLAVLERAVEHFTESVFLPALQRPAGIARITGLFERWMAWSQSEDLPGGCPIVAASTEFDDHPGPLRDFLSAQQARWRESLSRLARKAVETGEFRSDLDVEQFAFELNAIYLGFHFGSRLLSRAGALQQARTAIDGLIARSRPPAH